MQTRHFLTLDDCSTEELKYLIERARTLKRLQHEGVPHPTLQGKILAMIFEKSSTRTRVSFESGIIQLGGGALFLSPRDTQLGRGEPIEDTARVLCRMVDIIMIRTFAHSVVTTMAEHSSAPIINGLTDFCHPCQVLADMQTYFEHRGDIEGKTVTWIGDGNNMCHSYINATKLFNFKLRIACPEGFGPDNEAVGQAGDKVELVDDPMAAAEGADLLVTDVWASMGQEEEQAKRIKAFKNYQVNAETMKVAAPDAVFMHCLPAHRGEEVSADVIDGSQSIVWDEAENRLHAQKALMEFLLKGKME